MIQMRGILNKLFSDKLYDINIIPFVSFVSFESMAVA